MDGLLTLTQVKAWLQIENDDDDQTLTDIIDSATSSLVQLMQTDPRSMTVTERVSGMGAASVIPDRRPISAVSAVAIDGASIDALLWDFDDDAIWLKRGIFPRGRRNVTITYTAGYPDSLLGPVFQAARYTVKAFWEARAASMNVSSESFAGVVSQGYWPSGPGAIPPQAVPLVSSFTRLFAAL